MTFFDTNVLVYVFDHGEPGKQRTARERFLHHAHMGDLAFSTQVLQEFYVTVTRKLAQPLDPAAAAAGPIIQEQIPAALSTLTTVPDSGTLTT